jgi:hypothetical protein
MNGYDCGALLSNIGQLGRHVCAPRDSCQSRTVSSPPKCVTTCSTLFPQLYVYLARIFAFVARVARHDGPDRVRRREVAITSR